MARDWLQALGWNYFMPQNVRIPAVSEKIRIATSKKSSVDDTVR
jgi:hypothetical protein